MPSAHTTKKKSIDTDPAPIYQEFSQVDESAASASHIGLSKIPNHGAKSSHSQAGKSTEKDPQKFDDSLDQFV